MFYVGLVGYCVCTFFWELSWLHAQISADFEEEKKYEECHERRHVLKIIDLTDKPGVIMIT